MGQALKLVAKERKTTAWNPNSRVQPNSLGVTWGKFLTCPQLARGSGKLKTCPTNTAPEMLVTPELQIADNVATESHF